MEHRDKLLTVTRVVKQKGRPITYDIYVDDELRLTVPESLLIEQRILPGKSVGPHDLDRWKYEGEKSIAWQMALEMLGRRARSSTEIKRMLVQKGFPHEIAEDTVSRCVETGYIDDLEYAKNWAEYRILVQSKGRRYVMEELRHKGIDRQLIERAIAEIDEQDEYHHALEAGRKRWQRLNDDVQVRRRKVGMFLARRGFESAVVNKVLRQLSEQSDADREMLE